MKLSRSAAFLLLATAFSCVSCIAQHLDFSVKKTFHIQSGGGWDYLAVCPANNLLYVSHGTQVNILDKTSGDSVGVIRGTLGVHGIAFAPELGKGFISNGRLNNVFVFDLKTNRVTDSIATGQNPDAIFYERFSKRIITCNGRSNDASVIDAVANKVVATIPLGGKPETAVSDGTGRMFVNIEDRNEVAVVDMRTLKVVQHYPLGKGEEPAGLAIDPTAHVLYVGCGNKQLVVLNTMGSLMNTFAIGDHCDGIALDGTAYAGIVYASCGNGVLSVLRYTRDGGLDHSIENIPTQRGARTIAVDPATHLVYLPTADFEPQPAGSKERPKMIPGTFRILVVGRQ